MKLENSAMKEHPAYNRHTVYLFFFDQGSDAAVAGYMPLNGQFGYIIGYKAANEATYYRTIAHELGHVIKLLAYARHAAEANNLKSRFIGSTFILRHTFSPDNPYTLSQGTTDNLMDYPSTSSGQATTLFKYQWDIIHNPERVWFSWLKEEEEAEIAGKDQLRNALQQIGINGCAFCKECYDTKALEGAINIKHGSKTFRCSFGRLKDDNTIEPQNITYAQNNTQRIDIGQLKISDSYKQFVILIKQEQSSIATITCEAQEDYSNYCTHENPFEDKTFTDKVIADINKCAIQTNYSGYKTSFAFNSSESSSFDEIKASILDKLQNNFFSNVKLCIELTNSDGKRETIFTKGLQNCTDADIRLKIHIDNENTKVYFDIDISDSYLQEYVSKWQQKAANKGYDDIDVESLRQQVIADLKSTEVQEWFGGLCQTLGSLINQKISGFVEVLQISQKICRSIWDEGRLPEGLWHSNKPESGYNNYPAYARIEPVIPGACDAVIDEIMGIPLIIKTGYQLMTDKQQRQAFSQIFTKEGLSSLTTALKDEVKQTFTDDQLLVYNSTKITTTVAFSLVTGGGNLLVKGGKKLDEIFGILDGLAQKFKNCPKLTTYLARLQESGQQVSEKIAKLSSNADKLGAELVEKLARQTDDIEKAIQNLDALVSKFNAEDIANAIKYIPDDEIEGIIRKLSKFRDCEGIEKIIKDLGTSNKKAIGSRLVLEYADNFDPQDVMFEVKEIIESGGKVTSRQYDAIIKGVRHEFKSWREWYSWSDDVIVEQLIKDLANPEIDRLDKLQWIFRKSEGITDEILKANIKKALSSEKAIRNILQILPEEKLIKWFDYDIEKKILTKTQIERFVEKNYSQIFKTY